MGTLGGSINTVNGSLKILENERLEYDSKTLINVIISNMLNSKLCYSGIILLGNS